MRKKSTGNPTSDNATQEFDRARAFALDLLAGRHVSVPPAMRTVVATMVGMIAFRKLGMTASEWRKHIQVEFLQGEKNQ